MFEGARSILVVKLSSIGDVVQSLPVAAALRRRYPEAHIAWAVKPPAAEVVAGNPHLTETLVVGGSGASAAGVQSVPPLGAPIRLARALRERRFELALDMQGLLKSALIAYLSGARDRIGFRNLQEGAFLFNNRRIVPDRRDIHAVEVYLAFAEAVGAPAGPPDFTIATSEEDRRVAAELLAEVDNPVALIPGARWESKRWPPERFAAVADALSEELGCTAVVVGGAGDRELAEGIAAAARSRTVDLTGKTTLKQLTEVFRGCRATISNETGPMYISAAAGTPTVAIFGPTDPNRLGPYGEGHAKVTAGVPCGPCRKRRCEPLRCMEAIGPEQVLEAARGVMGGTASGGRSGGVGGSA
ncbi:MAG: lipopolysaccharide heptosyltransferase II [Proteobacteria bacterium]|nr:lipopolysaccharide heptosyltransferase II [Pseudomonadota bacterium]